MDVTEKYIINNRRRVNIQIRLTNSSPPSNFPSLSVTAAVLHVVWSDDRNGNIGEIYYKRSTNGGLNWESDVRLTNDSAVSNLPSVSVSGAVVHVVWYDFRNGNNEIYYKRSTDAGLWEPDVRPNNIWFFDISCVRNSTVIHAVWYDDRDECGVYYKRSSDAGLSGELIIE
jgi:hypothetical protein